MRIIITTDVPFVLTKGKVTSQSGSLLEHIKTNNSFYILLNDHKDVNVAKQVVKSLTEQYSYTINEYYSEFVQFKDKDIVTVLAYKVQRIGHDLLMRNVSLINR